MSKLHYYAATSTTNAWVQFIFQDPTTSGIFLATRLEIRNDADAEALLWSWDGSNTHGRLDYGEGWVERDTLANAIWLKSAVADNAAAFRLWASSGA